jgi:hypothetical protein
LCLDSPGWEDRAKHPFDVIFEVCTVFSPVVSIFLFCPHYLLGFFIQFVSEECEHSPLILFLKDVDKVCGNSYSYHGLKSKLENFPAGVFIIGSQTQTETRKDKVLIER